jgi:outer membrane protein assembly factor BamB
MACTAYAPPAPAGARLGPVRQDTPWTVYLGTARHDVSAAETLSADPRPLWHTAVGHAVRGGAAFGETVMAVGTVERQVVLLDRATGQVLWKSRLKGTVHGGPLLDGDRVYVATEESPEGRVYALSLRDGRQLWSTRTGGVAAPLALAGDTLYAASDRGILFRLGTDGGKIAWRRQLSGAPRAGAVPTPAGIAVATTSDTLFLVAAGTGEIAQRLALPGSVLDAPALDSSRTRLYLGTTGGHVLAVGLPDLTVAWDVTAGDAVYGAPALARDTVFALTRDGTLWLIPRAGVGARSVPLGIVCTAGPTPLGHGVLAGSVSGEVVLVDPASGGIIWRVQIDGPIETPPLVRDGQLVVIGGHGDIHVYR